MATMMRKQRGKALGAAAAALALVGAGWILAQGLPVPIAKAPAELVPPGPAPDFIVLATGDVGGLLETCGCPVNPMGSLARRLGYVKRLRAAYPDTPVFLVDTGAFAGDLKRPDGRLRTEALLEAYESMGYAAVNVAYPELMDGFATFEALRAKAPNVPFVSASWVRNRTKEPLLGAAHASREFASKAARQGGMRRIAFVGMQHTATGATVRLPDGGMGEVLPITEAAKSLAAIRKGHDVVVVLARADGEEVKKLLDAAGANIDLVAASLGQLFSEKLEAHKGVPFAMLGFEGRVLNEFRFHMGRKDKLARVEFHSHRLTHAYPEDAAMEFFTTETLQRIAEIAPRSDHHGHAHHDEPPPTRVAVPQTVSKPYVGSEACMPCHAAAYDHWKTTAHARAFDTLVKGGQDFNPACISCHVTGYREGGFRNMRSTPHFAGVGCEACHGPGGEHVADPKVRMRANACTVCHDHVQSPQFDLKGATKRILHWGADFAP